MTTSYAPAATIPRGSKEYVGMVVNSDATLTAATIVVMVQLDRDPTPLPDAAGWRAPDARATVLSPFPDPDNVFSPTAEEVKLLVGPTSAVGQLVAGQYRMFAMITDTPEKAIIGASQPFRIV